MLLNIMHKVPTMYTLFVKKCQFFLNPNENKFYNCIQVKHDTHFGILSA